MCTLTGSYISRMTRGTTKSVRGARNLRLSRLTAGELVAAPEVGAGACPECR